MEQKTLHMIGNAHIDPVWLWCWQDGFQEIKATFRSALDRMGEYDDFVFTASSAAFYAWVERNDPEMFAEIKARVKEGRWQIVGGWWVEPDTNIPCGESFARHALYSQRYFEEKFGITCRTGYSIDSFGHTGALPQILRLSGMDRYVFMRPGRHEKALPGSLFFWQGSEGTQVACFRVPYEYCTWGKELNSHVARCALDADATRGIMCFYGVGNHGGGPTIENLESIKALNRQNGLRLTLSSPDRFFDEALKVQGDLPVVEGDLLHHASGCYAAHSGIKQWIRQGENRLLSSEKWSAIASAALSTPYPANDLGRAWKKVLFNQFHDILAGTSLFEAYEDARNELGFAMSVAADCQNDALQALSWKINIPYAKEQRPLVVFHPHAFDIKWPVEMECAAVPQNMRLMDDIDNIVPYQIVDSSVASNGRVKLCFVADLPAMGYRTYRLVPCEGFERPGEEASAEPLTLCNEAMRVVFDKNTGCISSLKLAGMDAELLRGPGAQAQLMQDNSDTWSHEVLRFDQHKATMHAKSVTRTESGPVRNVIRVVSAFEQSSLCQEFILYKDLPVLFVRTTVDFHQTRTALKLRFPVNLNYCQITAQAPYGYADRVPNGEEHPMHGWLDVTGAAPGRDGATTGLALLNDGKYSYDAHDRALHLTVLRSPFYANHTPFVVEQGMTYPAIDQGIQRFTYALAPHLGPWQQTDMTKSAQLLNQPPIVLPETFHPGLLPQSASYAKVEGEGVLLTALKLAEDGSGDVIVHLDQVTRKACRGMLRLPLLGREIPLELRPGQVLALRIPRDAAQPAFEVDFMEYPMA